MAHGVPYLAEVGIETEPPSVGRNITDSDGPLRKRRLRGGNEMYRTILPTALRRQPAPCATVIVNLDNGDRFSDHKPIGRQDYFVLDYL